MLDVVQFPQTFNPTEIEILKDAYVRAADRLRYGPEDHDERRNLALILLRLARLDGLNEGRLVKEAVRIITTAGVTLLPKASKREEPSITSGERAA